MNSLDLILIGFAGYLIIKGLYRGFLAELFSLLALIIGYVVAYYFGLDIAIWVQSFFPDFKLSEPILFLLLFIATAVGVTQLGRLATKFSKIIALGLLNRVLGGLFGLAKALLVLTLFWFAYGLLEKSIEFKQPEMVSNSMLYPYIENTGKLLAEFIP